MASVQTSYGNIAYETDRKRGIAFPDRDEQMRGSALNRSCVDAALARGITIVDHGVVS